jgi:putative helicase MOV10L1
VQVQKIRLLLRERGLGAVRVGTVDDYQGQEERIIFISTARVPSHRSPAMHACTHAARPSWLPEAWAHACAYAVSRRSPE